MSLFIASLNSGSNGNCYYVGNEHEAVLVDAGISCRETERRMLRLGLSIRKVKAIFVCGSLFATKAIGVVLLHPFFRKTFTAAAPLRERSVDGSGAPSITDTAERRRAERAPSEGPLLLGQLLMVFALLFITQEVTYVHLS